jgi:hypothetical protein
VDCLIEPLLKRRALAGMPCKHQRTFELARAQRAKLYDELGYDDPNEDIEQPAGYCDCIPFNRRAALWELGDLCLKFGLTRTQMRELAAIVLLVTREQFTYNHVRRGMHDMFQGAYKDYLRAYKRKREDGVSFDDVVVGLVPRWQHRMMPNI